MLYLSMYLEREHRYCCDPKLRSFSHSLNFPVENINRRAHYLRRGGGVSMGLILDLLFPQDQLVSEQASEESTQGKPASERFVAEMSPLVLLV